MPSREDVEGSADDPDALSRGLGVLSSISKASREASAVLFVNVPVLGVGSAAGFAVGVPAEVAAGVAGAAFLVRAAATTADRIPSSSSK